MLRDLIHVAESGLVRLRSKTGELIAGHSFAEPSVIGVKGWVKILAREDGKLVPRHCREGSNVFTTVGREWLTLLMQLAVPGPNREDRMKYIAVGTGSQPEEPGVLSLVAPHQYATGVYLALLDPPTFPLMPARTTASYHRLFAANEITLDADPVYITELALYTNGDPTDSYAPGSMDSHRTVGTWPPMAYKTFEPIGKTQALELDITWQLRF